MPLRTPSTAVLFLTSILFFLQALNIGAATSCFGDITAKGTFLCSSTAGNVTNYCDLVVHNPHRVAVSGCSFTSVTLVGQAPLALHVSFHNSFVQNSIVISVPILADAVISFDNTVVACVAVPHAPLTPASRIDTTRAQWKPLADPWPASRPIGLTIANVLGAMFMPMVILDSRLVAVRSAFCGGGSLAAAVMVAATAVMNSSFAFSNAQLVARAQANSLAVGFQFGFFNDSAVIASHCPSASSTTPSVRALNAYFSFAATYVGVYSDSSPSSLYGINIRGVQASALDINSGTLVDVGGVGSFAAVGIKLWCSVGVTATVEGNAGSSIRSLGSATARALQLASLRNVTLVVADGAFLWASSGSDAAAASSSAIVDSSLTFSVATIVAVLTGAAGSTIIAGITTGNSLAAATNFARSTLRVDRCTFATTVPSPASGPFDPLPGAVVATNMAASTVRIDGAYVGGTPSVIVAMDNWQSQTFGYVRNVTWASAPAFGAAFLLGSMTAASMLLIREVQGPIAQFGFDATAVGSAPTSANLYLTSVSFTAVKGAMPQWWRGTFKPAVGYYFTVRCLAGPGLSSIASATLPKSNSSCQTCLQGVDCMGGNLAQLLTPTVENVDGQCLCTCGTASVDPDCVDPAETTAHVLAVFGSLQSMEYIVPQLAATASQTHGRSRSVQGTMTRSPLRSMSRLPNATRSLPRPPTHSGRYSLTRTTTRTRPVPRTHTMTATRAPEIMQPLEKALMEAGFSRIAANHLYYFVSTSAVGMIGVQPYLLPQGVLIARMATPFDCEAQTLGLQVTPEPRDVFVLFPMGDGMARYLKGALALTLSYVFIGQGLLAMLLHNVPRFVYFRTITGFIVVAMTGYFLPTSIFYSVKIAVTGQVGDGFIAAGGSLCVVLLLAFPVLALHFMPSVYLAYRMFDRWARNYANPIIRYYQLIDMLVAVLISAAVGATTQSSVWQCGGSAIACVVLSLVHLAYVVVIHPMARRIDLVHQILLSVWRLTYAVTVLSAVFLPGAVRFIAYFALAHAALMWAGWAAGLSWRGFLTHRREMLQLTRKRGLFELEVAMTDARLPKGQRTEKLAKKVELTPEEIEEIRVSKLRETLLAHNSYGFGRSIADLDRELGILKEGDGLDGEGGAELPRLHVTIPPPPPDQERPPTPPPPPSFLPPPLLWPPPPPPSELNPNRPKGEPSRCDAGPAAATWAPDGASPDPGRPTGGDRPFDATNSYSVEGPGAPPAAVDGAEDEFASRNPNEHEKKPFNPLSFLFAATTTTTTHPTADGAPAAVASSAVAVKPRPRLRPIEVFWPPLEVAALPPPPPKRNPSSEPQPRTVSKVRPMEDLEEAYVQRAWGRMRWSEPPAANTGDDTAQQML